MARSTDFAAGSIIAARSGATVIAADSATLSDANIPPASAVNCQHYDSIFVGVNITGGSSPTMTIEPLFRDADAADGARWKRLTVGAPDGVTLITAATATTGALTSDGPMVELKTFGWPSVFPRIATVTNATSTTAWSILVMPGKLRA